MKQIFEEFKNGRLAVNCQTEEEAKHFVGFCFENGITWLQGSDVTTTYFHLHKRDTYYLVFKGHLSRSHEERGGKGVYTYTDFMKVYNREFGKSDLETSMPPIQLQNYMNLLDALGLKKEDLTESVNKTITYLATDDVSTVNDLCSAIRQSRGVQ